MLLTHKIDLTAEAPKSLKVKGSVILKHNNAETDFSHIGADYIAVTGQDWSEYTDVINTASGEIWRIPLPVEEASGVVEKRAAQCLYDGDAFYIAVAKGFDAISRNLIKLSPDTKEALWTCGLSMGGGIINFAQDSTTIYYTDDKNALSIDKVKGKRSGKYKYTNTENPVKKKIVPPYSSHINAVTDLLERHGKGGLFGTGEVFVLQTETLQDDMLAMAILDGLEGRQRLDASEKAIIQQLKDTYSGYLNRNVIFYPGIMQVVCVNGSDTNSLSFFMYTAMGDSIAGATNGNKDSFGRTVDKDYVDFLTNLLTERGLEKWLKAGV